VALLTGERGGRRVLWARAPYRGARFSRNNRAPVTHAAQDEAGYAGSDDALLVARGRYRGGL